MSNLSTLFDRYKALVVFDTETSGLDFDSDQIIELAALRVERTATGGIRIAGKMDTLWRGGDSMSPEITITSEELRERVEDHLDRWIPDDVWNRAEPYARHKNEVNRQRHPEIDYYDNDYLVLLTADTVRETEFSDLTHALCDLTVARAQ